MLTPPISSRIFTIFIASEYIELRNSCAKAGALFKLLEGGNNMRRDQCRRLAAIAGAFGLGALLVLLSAYKLAFLLSALLLLAICRQFLFW